MCNCDKFPYHGAHGRLSYDLHDKNWKLHIGIKNPSNCKAETKKSGYPEIKFFDCKIQLEKVQLIRDLKDDIILYQGIRLLGKKGSRVLRSHYANTGNHGLVPWRHINHITNC